MHAAIATGSLIMWHEGANAPVVAQFSLNYLPVAQSWGAIIENHHGQAFSAVNQSVTDAVDALVRQVEFWHEEAGCSLAVVTVEWDGQGWEAELLASLDFTPASVVTAFDYLTARAEYKVCESPCSHAACWEAFAAHSALMVLLSTGNLDNATRIVLDN